MILVDRRTHARRITRPRRQGQDAVPVTMVLASVPQRSWQVAPEWQVIAHRLSHWTRQFEPLLQAALLPEPSVKLQLAPGSHSTRATSPAAMVQLLLS